MAEFEIPAIDWTGALAQAIKNATDGDVVIVRSEEMLNLALLAKSRLCPTKKIIFRVLQLDGDLVGV